MTPAALAVLAAAGLAASAPALAADAPSAGGDRPAEEDLFGGGPAKAAPQNAPEAAPARTGEAGRPAPGRPPAAEAERLAGEPGAEGRLLSELARTDNPLQIGGLVYLQAVLGAREGTDAGDWPFTVPTITDLYLDARPSDRVRGFVLGRMLFDPTQGTSANPLAGYLPGVSGGSASNPRVLLDQLWLRFDVERTAFVTAGRQHVKWGVGRFWNPTDFLHTVRKNPLATFDERTGTTMLRVHLPWERLGWNFYAIAVVEPLVQQATLDQAGGTSAGTGSTLGGVGGAGRAELLLGGWELGIDGAAQRGMEPRLGFDLSGGLWELDLRGELALRWGSDVPLYQGASWLEAQPWRPQGVRPQVVGGAEWSHNYSDEDAYTLGLEYFYNSNGYGDAALYPYLLAQGAYVPFYLGRHYLGAYLVLPRPGSWNLHTFTLSALANLSDQSALVRLDWSMSLLTYLTLEAFATGHLGHAGGEFRFGLDLDVPAPPATSPTRVFVGNSVADFGLALRLTI